MDEVAVMTMDLPGKSGEFVDWKAEGWKYKHLRLWEEANSAGQTAAVVSERIAGWQFVDETGAAVPFKAGEAALDELPRDTARWLVGTAYLRAYRQAGLPDPNA